MKQVYLIHKTLLMMMALGATSLTYAQSSSTTSQATCGAVVQNFNTSGGGHASPSIYGGTFDSAFYYNPTLGYWTEMDGGRTTLAGSNRVVTIISPPYLNPGLAGRFDLGFWYKTSDAVNDRFQVRLVALRTGPGGTTTADIVATSGAQRFTDWSTPAPFLDPNGNHANDGDTGHVCIGVVDADITNDANTFYRIEIAYVESNGRFAAYDNLTFGNATSPSPLPVNFIGIVGKIESNAVNVKWDVADEIRVSHYELERSTTGSGFATVGQVKASGSHVYSYMDPNIKAPVIYYRVKSVDEDGSVKYSGIIKVTNGTSYISGIRAYPSPATDQITIQHNRLGAGATFTVVSVDGRILKVVRPVPEASNTMIDLSNYAHGSYLIRLDDGNGKTESTTILKQ